MTTRARKAIHPTVFSTFILAVGLLASCGFPNLLQDDQDAFCRSMLAEVPANLREHVMREARKESPSGALTKPYSRHIWDEYWNNRIFHVRQIGPESCGGTYSGPPGEEMIADALALRRRAELPELILEKRNRSEESSSGT